MTGKAAIEALEPFALGFLEAAQTWPGILDTNSRAVARSLHGVLRHLPEEALGDFAQVKTIWSAAWRKSLMKPKATTCRN